MTRIQIVYPVRLLGSLLVLALALAVPLSAAAQSPLGSPAAAQEPQGRTIEEIRIDGNDRFDDDTVRFYVGSRVGAPFDWSTARLDYQSLFNTTWFRNVVMRWEDGANGGIVLIIEVEELPLLRQIKIVGTSKVNMEQFVERLELIDRNLEINTPVNGQLLRDNIEVLTFMLQGDEGLQFVQVDLDLVESELGAGVDAIYNVIEGDSVRIAQVMFDGNTLFTDQELRWRMKRTGEHYFMSFLRKNDRFSRAGFEFDMRELNNLYSQHGYLQFNWGEPIIEVFTENRALWWNDKQRLAVTIPIQEGPQFFVGEIRVEGNTRFTQEELLDAVGLTAGEVFNVQEVTLAREAIQNKYTEAGYLQVAVAMAPAIQGENVADLVFQVAENDEYRVNRIEFAGNTHTRDFVLRRNMNIHELSRWDQRRFNSSIERLWRLGYFQNVEHELTPAAPGQPLDPSSAPDPQYGAVDVDVNVEEIGRNQITFGGGLSALEGGFIQFGYTTRNLFGYGQTLAASGQVGALRQNVRLQFSDPYFLGSRFRFGADLFRDALDFPDFQREGTGGAVRFGRSLNFEETLSVFLEYNYELIDVGQVSSTLTSISSPLFSSLFLQGGRQITSSLRPFVFYSNMDNPFLPSRGSRTSASFELAGGDLGGTLDFWRVSLRTTWWLPTVTAGSGFVRQPKQVLAVNVRADYAQPYGELEEMPIFERFFLGGSNSVRGTRLRSIGPIDERGNILGGTKALQYNIEYIFQLTSSFRVKGFHDAGQAWDEAGQISFADLRKTAGLEFEIFAPVFNVPMRFFWAYNFDPLELFGEERSTFEFAIGSTF